MRTLNSRLKQLEKELNSKDNQTTTDHQAFMAERTKMIEDYLKNDEPMESITQQELNEFDPMLKSLYEKYMTEHIEGD